VLEKALVRGFTVAFFILANSFFVAAEYALISVRKTRIEQLVAQGRPGAATALRLKNSIEQFLPASQLGVTLASLALGWEGEPIVAHAFETVLRQMFIGMVSGRALIYAHALALPIAFIGITYFQVLLGELVPKSLALQRAEQIAVAIAGPLDIFIRLTRPLIMLMNYSATLVLRLFHAPMRSEASAHSPEEIKMIATAARMGEQISEPQENIIHRAIELNQIAVREIMTPRRRIFALPADMTVSEATARVVEEQRSRIPIYEPGKGPEHIIGVVYSKDLSRLTFFRLNTLLRSHIAPPHDIGQELQLRQLMREPLLVPETKLVVELLQDFQQQRKQLAIVVDEFGTTTGLVTAEDALEQIVGEMEDEFDIADKPIISLGAGAVILDGSANLRDLEMQMQWRLPREAGVETLGGFLMAQMGRIPVADDSVEFGDRRYTVTEMHGHRIGKVKVEMLPEKEEEEAAE
jgi:CBS domain containing-hemolysin-like protein